MRAVKGWCRNTKEHTLSWEVKVECIVRKQLNFKGLRRARQRLRIDGESVLVMHQLKGHRGTDFTFYSPAEFYSPAKLYSSAEFNSPEELVHQLEGHQQIDFIFYSPPKFCSPADFYSPPEFHSPPGLVPQIACP